MKLNIDENQDGNSYSRWWATTDMSSVQELNSGDLDGQFHDFAVVNGDSFQPNNGYIGVEAANDEEFVTNEYNRLNKAWHRYLETGILEHASDTYGL